ncbi:MAG: beta-eliminating lyase-related protein, partial [Pseudomonadota bacterium]
MSFASDNSVGVCPQILDAMARANDGFSDSYGEDGCTKALQDRFSALFERRCYVFPVATGTAANALALAAITPPWGRILCHEYSHIEEHECGAPEFFTGGARLHRLGGADGRLDVRTVQALLGLGWQGNVHRAQPSALSFSNVTEMGTC